MSFGQFINPDTGLYTDDHLIGKAFEALRIRFGPNLPAAAARPFADWHDDDGVVLWWKLPVEEPPYVGSPLCKDWPGYHTHWTPLPPPPVTTRTLADDLREWMEGRAERYAAAPYKYHEGYQNGWDQGWRDAVAEMQAFPAFNPLHRRNPDEACGDYAAAPPQARTA